MRGAGLGRRLGLEGWLEDRARLMVRAPLDWEEFVLGRLGELGLLFLGLQAVTGFWLLVHYSPEAGRALASVRDLDHLVWGGWWCRRLHAAGGMLLVFMAVGRGGLALAGGLDGQARRRAWLSGAGLAALLLAMHASGLVLSWSGAAQGMLSRLWGESGGGSLGGGPGLALALHLTLPLAALILGWLHVRQARGRPPAPLFEMRPLEPSWPHGLTRLAFLLGAGLAAWLALALLLPNLLLLPDLDAGRGDLGPVALHWYLWAPAALAQVLPRGWGIVLALLAGLGLLLWPWWDRGSHRPLLRRPLAGKVGLALALLWLFLSLAGWWGGRP